MCVVAVCGCVWLSVVDVCGPCPFAPAVGYGLEK